MTELQSYVFDFKRVDDFFDRWNVDWKTIGDFGVSNKFQIVLAYYSPSNISECLNNGVIDASVIPTAQTTSQDCTLNWENDELSIASDVIFSITGVKPIKGVFVRHKASGVVLGYCLNINSFEVSNQVIFEKDTILWSIRDG